MDHFEIILSLSRAAAGGDKTSRPDDLALLRADTDELLGFTMVRAATPC